MLTLHHQSATAKTPDAQARLQRQIDADDRQIYRLVYELCGRTEEDKRIGTKGDDDEHDVGIRRRQEFAPLAEYSPRPKSG
jgi:hypothetical protein